MRSAFDRYCETRAAGGEVIPEAYFGHEVIDCRPKDAAALLPLLDLRRELEPAIPAQALRRAESGVRLAARMAGTRPPATPIATAKAMDSRTVFGVATKPKTSSDQVA